MIAKGNGFACVEGGSGWRMDAIQLVAGLKLDLRIVGMDPEDFWGGGVD